jgi:hypothetical protein
MILNSYIDGATGSYLVAAIASGGAGVWYLLKNKLFFWKKRSSKNSVESDES